MRPFGWGYRKDMRPATRITTTHYADVRDMVEILTWRAIQETIDGIVSQQLTTSDVEKIVRETYFRHGESIVNGDAEWADDLRAAQFARVSAWAQLQIKRLYPDEYEAGKGQGWL